MSPTSCIKCTSTAALAIFAMTFLLATARLADASTYVVYLPLDSPIYEELDTLNSLGYLDDYLDEIKPISRIEAARLTIEARAHLNDAPRPDQIARDIVRDLRDKLREEVGWLQSNNENNPPTAMLNPLDRAELQYIYTRGPQRFWNNSKGGNVLQADEGTPLLPNNDGIATASGSNEIARLGAWGGFGGFLTAYGEAAMSAVHRMRRRAASRNVTPAMMSRPLIVRGPRP